MILVLHSHQKTFIYPKDWIILVQAIKGVLLVPIITQCTCNTLLQYIKNPLTSIMYLLKPRGVLHSHTKTYKESNTFFGVIYKHHGLNYFGLGYRRGITHAYNYLIHMHYLSHGIP